MFKGTNGILASKRNEFPPGFLVNKNHHEGLFFIEWVLQISKERWTSQKFGKQLTEEYENL